MFYSSYFYISVFTNSSYLVYSEVDYSSHHFCILSLIPSFCDNSLRISGQEFVIKSGGLRPGHRSHLSNSALFGHHNVWWRLKFVKALKTNFLNFSVLLFSLHSNTQIRISFSNHLNRRGYLKDKELINKRRSLKSDSKPTLFCRHTAVGADINSGMW
jgi:hypothetical protein